jgi:hypothetical protein
VVGRSVTCDVVLRDDPDMPTISRKHLRIDLQGNSLSLEDLSSNGTRVGEHLMTQGEVLPLPPDCVLMLGPSTTIKVEFAVTAPTGRELALQLNTLGHLEALVNGLAIPHSAWPSSQVFCLLTMLVDAAQFSGAGAAGLDRDLIVRALGPSDPRTVLEQLSGAFARWPGQPALPLPFAVQGGRISLAAYYRPQYDVAEVAQMAQNLRTVPVDVLLQQMETLGKRWSGPFLAGLTEPWARHRRGQIEGLLQEPIQRLSGATLPAQMRARAAALFRTLAQQDPCHLSIHLAFLRELARENKFDEMKQRILAYERDLNEIEATKPSTALRQAWKRLLDSRFGNV